MYTGPMRTRLPVKVDSDEITGHLYLPNLVVNVINF